MTATPGALAQCPDGTPPPCGARARVAHAAPPTPAERGRRFLILPFRNLTRAADQEWLVEGSTTMLADALGRWREITVVPDERLYPALRRNALASGTVMDPARVRHVAEETGGWTAVNGEVVATAGRLRVSAHAYDVVTGRETARASVALAEGEDIRAMFDRLGASLLRGAGLDFPSGSGPPTTSSLDAYRAYLLGVQLSRRAQFRQARTAFLEAVRLDSTFALPWAALAEATLFLSPLSVIDPQSAIHRYAARAAELSSQLPPDRRDEILALQALFQLQYTAARQILERLVSADSSDPEVVAWLAFLEVADPVLVPVPGGQRPRGSLNRAVRLARRVLDPSRPPVPAAHLARGSLKRSVRLARRVLALAPDNHAAFILPTFTYLVAGGASPGLMPGVSREAPSYEATFLRGGMRLFVPLVTDSVILVPAESLATWSADSLAAARKRALDAARSWVDRWLAVGRTEGEAWAMAGVVSELQGDLGRALNEYAAADSLGVEVGLISTRQRRVAVLGKLTRYDTAYAAARQIWDSGRLEISLPFPTTEAETFAWTFNLCLMKGDFARADTVFARFSRALVRSVNMSDTTLGAAMSLPLISGASVPPIWQLELPAAFRVAVMDSLWLRRDAIPENSRLARMLPTLQRLVSRTAAKDSVLAERARAAPWYRPAQ